MNKKAFLVITIFLMAVTGCTAQSPPAFDPEILPSPTTTDVDPAFIPALPPLTEIDSDEPFQLVPTHPAPTETAIPSWEERMQEAKTKENAQLIPSKDLSSYADEIGVPYSNIYTAVENHRKIIRNQGLKVDNFNFDIAVEGDYWVVVVRNKKTDVFYWAVDSIDQNSFNSQPDQKIGNGVLKPIRSPQHGEKIVLVISNNEVFAFYENGEGRKTAVFNQEIGRVTRWEDTPYWKGIEALRDLGGVEFVVNADGVNRIAHDGKGNTLANLEEGRERWVYTMDGLDAIVPSDESVKNFFDKHVDMRRHTTTDNINYHHWQFVNAVDNLNVIIYQSSILAELPGKELVVDGKSMGNVYVLTPSVAKWRGKGGEDKYYHLFFLTGVENFSRITLGPGAYETLDLGSEKTQKVFEVGQNCVLNPFIGYNFELIPRGWKAEDVQSIREQFENEYRGFLPMTDLFGQDSGKILMNMKSGKDMDGSIIIGPTNGVYKY
jgi:hypothetical protein